MGDYTYRVMNGLLASEVVPAFLRRRAMRAIGFQIGNDSTVWAGANFRSTKVKIGNNVFINVGFYHDGYDLLEVGDNVRIGPFLRVLTATHDIGPSNQRGQVEVIGKPVHIRDGSWIGSGVTILPGVIVDKGCVVAANSVVYESTEPDGLYAGNPARRVRELGP